MSDKSPSQAEGERDHDKQERNARGKERRGHPNPRRPPSQAEGERTDGGSPRDAPEPPRPRRRGA
ncbi:hypothetical protein [Streptomyces sp. SBT349]|uniref:hypothetical protein n=1 Tax=Streptomyces sp. SBT349 TaxID=1580539 RepID=UPI00066A1500|nr:hypothetical protein [Streptomyces sp. SBT349]